MCAACLPHHLVSSGNHRLYPLSLIHVYWEDEAGRYLKQGETVDRFNAVLTESLQGIRPLLVKKVTDTFEELQRQLAATQEKTLSRVHSYVNEFEVMCTDTMERLTAMKYSPQWVGETDLEIAIQSENWVAINELIANPIDWTFELEEYKRRWESLDRFKSWKYLFQPSEQEPKCIAIANGTTQVFELPTLKPLRPSAPLQDMRGALLCLPTNEWFFSDSHSCFTITPDFQARRFLCDFQENRICPGLAYYRGLVYMFGGRQKECLLSTVDCVSLDYQSSRLLPALLPISLQRCVPCRHNDTLYFGAIPAICAIFLFRLATERFEVTQINFTEPNISIALAFPNDEVIFLSQGGTYAYQTHQSEVDKIGMGSIEEFDSEMVPVKRQGIWYFFGKTNEVNSILSMSERDRELRHVGIYE